MTPGVKSSQVGNSEDWRISKVDSLNPLITAVKIVRSNIPQHCFL